MSDEPTSLQTPGGASEDPLLDDLRVVLHRRTVTTGSNGTGDELIGQTVGPYVVSRLLGEGGMARVYEGLDAASDRRVALKILKPQYAADRALAGRFEREARGMAQIQHENVVHILDFPVQGQVRAIVMELLPGGSLQDRLLAARTQRHYLPVQEAISLIVQATAGVHAAHKLGIVHRDIKPSNLLLDANGRIKVADFGTIMVTEGTTWLTGVGQQIGTPGYMSPEQCEGKRVTAASDVYSLGATLFELLTNRLPFEVEEASPFAIMLKHISEPAPDPRTWRTDVSRDLAGVVLKSLAKNPKARFANAGELGEALLAEPTIEPPAEPEEGPEHGVRVDVAAIRKQLMLLPQRAIVCWACRCARRVQDLNRDPRIESALTMAEATLQESADGATGGSVSRALSRIRALRAASLQAACAQEKTSDSRAAMEAARAAAAAAASAASVCVDDAAADAAFAARSATAALRLAGEPVRPFWDAARSDYHRLVNAKLGQEGTVGRPIPQNLFQP
ncbi:MAG: serine/threonine protein kinase [Phycisphaerae bacterium]|nr:serine/threonine protein kinase [Phycisphaerae bacterium]